MIYSVHTSIDKFRFTTCIWFN